MSTRVFTRLAATVASSLFAGLALASPCTAPASYVKSPDAARSPLQRPFLINGVATTAVQLRDNERWLELAVHSAATAQRLLAGRADGARLTEVDGAVLLACRGLDGSDARGLQQAGAPLAPPLW